MTRRRRLRADDGNAVVEVAFLAPVLLVPLAWAAIALALVVAAQTSVISAARQASRAYVLGTTPVTAARSARQVAATVIAKDAHGLTRPSVKIGCAPTPCLSANSRTDVTVTTTLTLGFLPLPFTHAPRITLSSTQSALVDPYRG